MNFGFHWHPASRKGRDGVLLVALFGVLAIIGVVVYDFETRPGPETGALYYTTFENQALYKVSFSFHGGAPRFGDTRLVTRLPAADGVTFEPDGHALVGGQGTGDVEEVDTSTGTVTTVASGCPEAYLLALSPSGQTVYTAGLPGLLCAMPTDPLRPGRQLTLHGDDTQVTDIAFDQAGQAFYTTGGIGGLGNFGIINLSTGATTREITGLSAAHGIAFDPYTKTLFLFGGDTVDQIDPADPTKVLGSMNVPAVQFDNGTTDGRGHLYVASNFGQLLVVDYHQSRRVGDLRNVVTEVHAHAYLDDVAPLVGPGASPGSRKWILPAVVGLGVLVLLLLLYRYLPSVRVVSQLPTWDIRRKEADRSRREAFRRRFTTRPRTGPSRPPRPGGPPKKK